MRKYHLGIAAIAFLMCLISVFFGVSIYNANENFLIEHLNTADQIYYFDIEQVPGLSHRAAIFTFPLILGITGLSIFLLAKKPERKVKNLLFGTLLAVMIIMSVAIGTIINPVYFDFSQWGFIWVCLGLFISASNVLAFLASKKAT